jgi:hypothetical protein
MLNQGKKGQAVAGVASKAYTGYHSPAGRSINCR